MPEYPILDYDPDRRAIVNPIPDPLSVPAPDRAVLCFFLDVIQARAAAGQLVQVGAVTSELGENPVYLLEGPAGRALVVHPGIGAPLAAGFTEEVIAMGVSRLVACGGSGVLVPEIAAGHPVILTSAVRDEGTSYHYLPPSREVLPDPAAVAVLESVCAEAGIDYRLGKTWTTDGYYRETPDRRLRRLEEGCIVVEMEAAAFFAVAAFRGVQMGQIVYGGDLVLPEGWDHRSWNRRRSDRELLFDLAVEACLRLP